MSALDLARVAAEKLERLAADLDYPAHLGTERTIAESRSETVVALERLHSALFDDAFSVWLWWASFSDSQAVADHGPQHFRKRAAAWRAFAGGAS